ncbi:MAG TPA: ABC transporter ATP-binding protein [Vicinamibacterales bacterium]|nr:ABC transporter ATP-binding protein [Vicinamibacterales bacterium]
MEANARDNTLLDVRALAVEFAAPRRGLRASIGRAPRAGVRVVDGVSFHIARGETLGLVGESGSGKSMTALALAGLVPKPGRIAGGTVRFEGRELTSLREAEWRRIRGARIGFVFQEPSSALNPVFTIGSQIAEALEVHGRASGSAARARAVELLDAVRIPSPAARAGDYPHQWSGGMKQRALLAAAIACDPALLIADEPTTALDVRIQAEILDLLAELRDRLGLSLLVVTHDFGVVERLADRVAVMYAGRAVESGPAREVLAAPSHPYTRGLLASRPGATPGRRLAAIPGSVPDPAALPRGCAFAPRCPERIEACDERRPGATAIAPGREVRCLLREGTA